MGSKYVVWVRKYRLCAVLAALVIIAIISAAVYFSMAQYQYRYNIEGWQPGLLTLAKGEVLKGKLVVEYGEIILLVTAYSYDNPPYTNQSVQRVVDSGIVKAGGSYLFSVRAETTYTRYQFQFRDGIGKFYSNLSNLKFYR